MVYEWCSGYKTVNIKLVDVVFGEDSATYLVS